MASQKGWVTSRNWRITLGLVGLAVILFGGWTMLWNSRQAATLLRGRLLEKAVTAARAINPELVQALSFTIEDREKPQFQRLEAYLHCYATNLGIASLYTMALRDGALYFGPESLDQDHPYASPPGTEYHSPPPMDFDVFSTARPVVYGPIRDEFGDFVSAVAPVICPSTGRVLMAVGVDMEAELWRKELRRAIYKPGLFTAILLLVIFLGGTLLEWRGTLSPEKQWRLRHVETFLCALLGILCTLAVTEIARQNEMQTVQNSFREIYRADAAGVEAALRNVENNLMSLGRFFEGSAEVSQNEFHEFADPLSHITAADGWLWVQTVPWGEVGALEERMRKQGHDGFTVWRLEGQPAPPGTLESEEAQIAVYMAPFAGFERGYGLDHASEENRRATMEMALHMGLPVATMPVRLPAIAGAPEGFLVFHPASSETQKGFVAAAVRIDQLLARAMLESSEEQNVSAGLFLLDHEAPPRLLSTWPNEGNNAISWHNKDDFWAAVSPVFLFGRTYALVMSPKESPFTFANMQGTLTAVIAGLLLTLLLTLYSGGISNQRARLAHEVARQTAALEKSEARLRMAIEASRQGIFDFNLATGEGLVNDQYAAMLGYSPDEFHETQDTWLERVHPEDLDPVQIALEECLHGGGQTFRTEHRQRAKSGEWKWLLTSGMVVDRDAEGKSGRLVGTQTDVTERRVLADRMSQSQKMESVGRLAGGMAHDFNNMLQAIIGFAEMSLAMVPEGDPVHPNLLEVLKAAEHSAQLTRQLLTFARQQPASPQVLDFNTAISGTLNMLRRLVGMDIEVVWQPGDNLWPVQIDPVQVDQVLVNLAVNARDAVSGKGRLYIETKNVTLSEKIGMSSGEFHPGPHVMLMVGDNGCGMPPEVLQRVYEPFYTTKPQGEGTGLGLPTVYGIVSQNNGCIAVRSTVGRGTIFMLYLPKAEGRKDEKAESPPAQLRGGNETILLVDDEPALLNLGKSLLTELGYHVLAALTPRNALDIALRHDIEIHLLATDVMMPAMNGKELASRVREIRPAISVLYITGYSTDILDIHDSIDEKIHLLQKPYTTAALAVKVRESLGC